MAILINIKESLRKMVAVCDAELLGKYFEQGQRQLDIKKDFYSGEEKNKEEAITMLQELAKDDATFNIVGKNSVDAGIKAGIIDKSGIIKIQKIPFALSLL